MSRLPIRLYGDPNLHESCEPIHEKHFGSKWLIDLIDDMIDTMIAANGIGIAAPQVGIQGRACVVITPSGPLALINPIIVYAKGNMISDEGCLSMPDIFGKVRRRSLVVVEYHDKNGDAHKITLLNQYAACLQHEIDHLDGTLFVDKLVFPSKDHIDKHLADMLRSYSDGNETWIP